MSLQKLKSHLNVTNTNRRNSRLCKLRGPHVCVAISAMVGIEQSVARGQELSREAPAKGSTRNLIPGFTALRAYRKCGGVVSTALLRG